MSNSYTTVLQAPRTPGRSLHMRSRSFATRDWIRSVALVGTELVTGVALAAWKSAAARAASAAAARQPEPIESVNIAVAKEREYRPTTTAVGTVLALESITLRNRSEERRAGKEGR